MHRQSALDHLFGPERAGCVEDWAVIESQAPGTVSGLPSDMQEMLLQHCMLRLQPQHPSGPRGWLHVEVACDVHKLWAQLLAVAPAYWTEAGFLKAGIRRYCNGLGWMPPSVKSTQLFWSLLVEMGGCCETEREAALLAMEAKKAPLAKLLCTMALRDDDDFYYGEKELAWCLLEKVSTEAIITAHTEWCLQMGLAWQRCCRRAEKVLRWRGLRAAWASAVVRAEPRRP